MSAIADEFAELRPVTEFMAGFSCPWLVAGGWAIDLYLGWRSREHEDVDIVVFRPDQLALQEYLAGWHLQKVNHRQLEAWEPGEWLALPIHEIHARRDSGIETGELNDLEILLNERDGDLWRYRKNPQITRPVGKIALRTASGIPFLGPEVALLYKASYFAPSAQAQASGPIAVKSLDDFERSMPRLEEEQRQWLKIAIESAYPGHPWPAHLG